MEPEGWDGMDDWGPEVPEIDALCATADPTKKEAVLS